MTAKRSAGILLYRKKTELEFFLVHPGGPFFKNKDEGSWSVPKGEFEDDEEPLTAALREFEEETGTKLGCSSPIELKPVTLKSGKKVYAWAIEGDIDANKIVSNTCEIDWPPRSGKKLTIPEIDKGGWFMREQAMKKISAAQGNFIEEVISKIGW